MYLIECDGWFWRDYVGVTENHWCWTSDIKNARQWSSSEIPENIIWNWKNRFHEGKVIPQTTVLGFDTKNAGVYKTQ